MPRHSKRAAVLSRARASERGLEHWLRQWTLCPEAISTRLWRTFMSSSVICWDQGREISQVPESSFHMCCLRPVKSTSARKLAIISCFTKSLNNELNNVKKKNNIPSFYIVLFSLSPSTSLQNHQLVENKTTTKNRKAASILVFSLPNHGLNNYTIHYRRGEKWD